MDTLDELQKILGDAPNNSTLVDISDESEVSYMYYCEDNEPGLRILNSRNGEDAAIEYSDGNIRSLADIQRIVDLMNLNQEVHQQVNGYLDGADWEHWQAFNKKRF